MDLNYVYPKKEAKPAPSVSLLTDAQIAQQYVQERESGDTPTVAALEVISQATGVQAIPPESVKRICCEVDDEIVAMRKISAQAAEFADAGLLQAALNAVRKHLDVNTWLTKLYAYHGVADFTELKGQLEAVEK